MIREIVDSNTQFTGFINVVILPGFHLRKIIVRVVVTGGRRLRPGRVLAMVRVLDSFFLLVSDVFEL